MYIMGRISTMAGQGFHLRYYGIVKAKNLQTMIMRGSRFGGPALGTAAAVTMFYVSSNELRKTKDYNLGMEPVP
jgi:hypothetical protein